MVKPTIELHANDLMITINIYVGINLTNLMAH